VAGVAEVGDVRVEVATAAAWREVRELRLTALADAPDAFGSTLAEERDQPEGFWRDRLLLDDHATFVAMVVSQRPPRPAGLAVLGPSFDGGQGVLGLYSVWVAPDVRGHGVGDALLRAVIGWATGSGATRIVLDVGDHNRSAIAFYARWGFTPTGRNTSLPPPREHVTEHERALDLRRSRGTSGHTGPVP
jgi:ribosomal protein S18 acetylase RimI-like enzyme